MNEKMRVNRAALILIAWARGQKVRMELLNSAQSTVQDTYSAAKKRFHFPEKILNVALPYGGGIDYFGIIRILLEAGVIKLPKKNLLELRELEGNRKEIFEFIKGIHFKSGDWELKELREKLMTAPLPEALQLIEEHRRRRTSHKAYRMLSQELAPRSGLPGRQKRTIDTYLRRWKPR